MIAGYLLKEQANAGDPFAQHELGLRLLLGQGFEKDTVLALKYIGMAADKNISTAKFNIGILQLNGIGLEWNPFNAYKFLKSAAIDGMPQAQFLYGLFFTEGLVVNKDLSKAYSWVKKAAENNYEPAFNVLKDLEKMDIDSDSLNEDTDSIPSDYQETLTDLSFSDYQLDFVNFNQGDNEKTDSTIFDLLENDKKTLAKKLGLSEIDSLAVEKLTSEDLIDAAVNAGSPEALYIKGKIFEDGIKRNKDILQAAVNYFKAFRLGSFSASKSLYELVNTEKFRKLIEVEAKKDNPDAMYLFAGLTAMGAYKFINMKDALNLLIKAVNKFKHIPSMIELGSIYFNGGQTERNVDSSVYYWRMATESENDEAKARLAMLSLSENNYLYNKQTSIKLLIEIANKGSVFAQTALGYCYEIGLGVELDKYKAATYYRYAAIRGNQNAFFSLKSMYDLLRPDEEEFKLTKEEF